MELNGLREQARWDDSFPEEDIVRWLKRNCVRSIARLYYRCVNRLTFSHADMKIGFSQSKTNKILNRKLLPPEWKGDTSEERFDLKSINLILLTMENMEDEQEEKILWDTYFLPDLSTSHPIDYSRGGMEHALDRATEHFCEAILLEEIQEKTFLLSLELIDRI